MGNRQWEACGGTSRTVFGLVALSLVFVPSLAGAQAPRTADDRPNLTGVWDFRTMTPLQRPRNQERETITEEEAAQIEQRAAEAAIRADAPSEVRTEPLPAGQPVGGYNNFWFDRGARVVEDRRTSLIVDPPTGRLPELTDGAIEQIGSLGADVAGARPVRYRVGGIGADGPEDRGLAERCLLGFNAGPPILPAGYNQNFQIFQTPDHVAILNEMVHDVRIIPLDRRPHLPDDVSQWLGDGRGYWDGDTLVVETRNFSDRVASFNSSVTTALGTGDTLNLTERFTRVDDDTLLYEFTVDDPATLSEPVTGVLQMQIGAAPMFEYACHEGNYGMLNLLSGARQEEREAASQP